MGEPSPEERDAAEAFASDSIRIGDLAEDLRRVLEFQRPEDAMLCILAAAQPHLGSDVLPEKCLAYVCFEGPKSSGKSVATEALCQIAGGRMIAGGTIPAMVRTLTGENGLPPRALGIDEVDNKGKLTPDLEGILRTGNRWHADYPISIPKGRGWQVGMQNVGGFKVFNYSGAPDDALASRTLMVSMRPVADPVRAASLAVESLFNNPILDGIRARLLRKASVAKGRWTAEQMEAHMREPSFVERVAKLDAALPRGKQLGAVLLAVADAMEWTQEAESIVAGYVAQRHEELSESEREVLAEIVRERLHEMRDGLLLLPSGEILGAMNQRLKVQGLSAVSARRWPTLRATFSIGSVRRATGVVLTFGPDAMKALGIDTENPGIGDAHGPGPPSLPPGGDTVRGGRNLMVLSDHVLNSLRWDPGKPDPWIARDAILALQLPEDSREYIEALVASMRRGMGG